MTVKEFINKILINNYQEILSQGFHYISFSLIALGIEFLGACIDDADDFGKIGKSGPRFRNAIEDLFPKQYQKFNDKNNDYDICNNLRNGLAHQLRPKSKIGLTHKKESEKFGTNHLEINNDKLVLVAEEFYRDFRNACTEVIKRIDRNKIKNLQVYKQFLSTPQGQNGD